MKKAGKLLLCVVPALIALLAMNIIAVPVVIVMMVGRLMNSGLIMSLAEQNMSEARIQSEIIRYMTDMMNDKAFIGDMNITALFYYNLAAIIGFGLFYGLVMKNRYPAGIRKVFSPSSAAGILVLFAGLEGIVSTAMLGLSGIFPKIFEDYSKLIEQSGLAQLSLISTIASVLLAPISEEIIFRGITLKLARRFTAKFWLANCIQAVLFGIMHMNIVQGLYAFAIGLVLGYVYSKFHSLAATVLAHLSFNFVGTWIEAMIYGTDETVVIWKALAEAGIGAILCALGTILILRSRKTPANVERFEKEYAFDNPEHAVPVSLSGVSE